jgi:glycosyltransferase involved in cell wall biosynthesis
MIANCALDGFEVVEITNELPLNRLGGVGSAIESLISGFRALGVRALWYLVDHHYRPDEVERILREFDHVAIGSLDELSGIRAPVAHVHTYNHDTTALRRGLQGRRAVFTVHSLLSCEAESNAIVLDHAVRQQEQTFAACDQVVLLSYAELGHYRRLGYTALNPRVRIVHNGLRRPMPAPPSSRDDGTCRIGFCGRLVPRKRPEHVQWLLREPGFDDCRTLIAGRGFSAYARDLMADARLASRVRYLGWCGPERLESFYRAIDVLAVTSIYEPFGMVALEAMARRVPVVCTRVDGLVEVLGDAAVYAEDTSYEAFRAAMRRWRAMPRAGVQAMTERALARYEARFTDVAAARAYREVFGALRS